MHRGETYKPAICLIMHGTLYGGACEKLKAAGFTEALLVLHSMERRSVSSSSGHKYLPWDVVRHYHDLSEKEKKVVNSFSGDYNGIERLRKCKLKEDMWLGHVDDAVSSVSTGISSSNGMDWTGTGERAERGPPSQLHHVGPSTSSTSSTSGLVAKSSSTLFPYSRTIKVSRFSMASHVNNLLKWKEDEEASGMVPEGAEPIDEIFARYAAELSGLGSGSSSASWGGSGSLGGRVQIEVLIDRERRRQSIEVRGDSEEGVRDKAQQVEHMMALMNASRRVLRMHGWKSQHREALMGSVPLNQMMQRCRATVVFHSTDGYIVSEMMALSDEAIDMMANYLKALEPGEATWSFPHKHLVPEPRVRFWNSIRNRYGVMFEKKQKRDRLEVSAWGFGTLINDAYHDIRAASMGNPVVYATTGGGVSSKVSVSSQSSATAPTKKSPPAPPAPRESLMLSSAAPAYVPLLMPPPSSTSAARREGKISAPVSRHGPPAVAPFMASSGGIHVISYCFLDKEAAQFYCTYEDMFQRYLKHRFHVLAAILPTSSASIATAIATIPEEDEESGTALFGSDIGGKGMSACASAAEDCVVLDVRGKEENLNAAQAYLNDLSSQLNCYEIEFPSVNRRLYQEVVALQVRDITYIALYTLSTVLIVVSLPVYCLLMWMWVSCIYMCAWSQEEATRLFVQDADRTSDLNENPLDCPGLISIRLKPPVHAQGIRWVRRGRLLIYHVCMANGPTTVGRMLLLNGMHA